MVRSMFAAIAGLRAHQTKMDVIGNNIANVNTYGYKSARTTFKDAMYQSLRSSSNGGTTSGGVNSSQVGYGASVGSVDSLFTAGSYATTDSPLDCMIDGNGFFLTSTSTANSITTPTDSDIANTTTQQNMQKFDYSRVGNFNFDGNGYLVDGNGSYVYGYGAKTSGSGANATTTLDDATITTIRKPMVDGKPAEFESISISEKGVISGVQKDANGDQKIVVIGQVLVANVPNPNALEKKGGPYYTAKENTGIIAPNEAGVNTGKIRTNGLEMSNVDLSKEFSDMITTQRGFQANSRIITVTDSMLEELVNLKR